MSRKPTQVSKASRADKIRLVRVETRLLDLPSTPLGRQPTPAPSGIGRDVIGMVTLTRMPIVTPEDAGGRREVLANPAAVMWHRMQIFVPIRDGRRICCLEVPIEEGDRERWQAIDNWCATELFGWNSKRRSAEIRRGVRGTRLESMGIIRPLREELSRLLKGKAK